jgi:hypothetical protein
LSAELTWWPFGSLNKRVPPQGVDTRAWSTGYCYLKEGLRAPLKPAYKKLSFMPFAAPSAQKNENGIGQHIQTNPSSTTGQNKWA